MERKRAQARVLLWALPRTVSTAFLTCMSGAPDSQMFYEPYTSAFLFGSDRPYADAPRPDNQDGGLMSPAGLAAETRCCGSLSGFSDSICSYEWVQTQLEAPFEGKQLVFCKDIAYCLDRRYKYLPKGYKYIFLIRNPVKVIPSWKKLISDFTGKKENEFTLDELKPPVMPTGVGYGELLELYEHVKLKLDPDPVIIDADDLLENPSSVLSTCCQKTGMPYSAELLSWQGGEEVLGTWIVSKYLKTTIRNLESFDNVKKSFGFRKPNENVCVADLQPDVQKFIDICMPIYTKLHEQRMK